MTNPEIVWPREQAISRLALAESYWQKVLVDKDIPTDVIDAIGNWRDRAVAELIEAEHVEELADRILHGPPRE